MGDFLPYFLYILRIVQNQPRRFALLGYKKYLDKRATASGGTPLFYLEKFSKNFQNSMNPFSQFDSI